MQGRLALSIFTLLFLSFFLFSVFFPCFFYFFISFIFFIATENMENILQLSNGQEEYIVLSYFFLLFREHRSRKTIIFKSNISRNYLIITMSFVCRKQGKRYTNKPNRSDKQINKFTRRKKKLSNILHTKHMNLKIEAKLTPKSQTTTEAFTQCHATYFACRKTYDTQFSSGLGQGDVAARSLMYCYCVSRQKARKHNRLGIFARSRLLLCWLWLLCAPLYLFLSQFFHLNFFSSLSSWFCYFLSYPFAILLFLLFCLLFFSFLLA